MTSRPKKIMNTAEIFAAASRQMRSASDTKVPRPQEFDEDSAEEDLPTVSETLQNPIPKTIGPYEIRGTVGEGAFSLVKLAFHQPTRQYYACKVIERVRLKKNNLEARFTCEIRVHQQMHHHGIVDLVDILEDQHFFYVFLEFCPGGELFQHIVDNGRLTEDRAKPIMVQVAGELASRSVRAHKNQRFWTEPVLGQEWAGGDTVREPVLRESRVHQWRAVRRENKRLLERGRHFLCDGHGTAAVDEEEPEPAV